MMGGVIDVKDVVRVRYLTSQKLLLEVIFMTMLPSELPFARIHVCKK